LLYLGGSSSETIGNPFASYLESDPRLGFTAPWIKLQVLDVRGPGHFSAWQTDSFGAVTVWVATSDGLTASDVLFSVPGAHIHYNWGFTVPGDYEIDVRASAYLQYPDNPTFSDVTTFQFSVDSVDNGNPSPIPIPPPDERYSVVSKQAQDLNTLRGSITGHDRSITAPLAAQLQRSIQHNADKSQPGRQYTLVETDLESDVIWKSPLDVVFAGNDSISAEW
jgi:surface-anchored protein